MILVTGANGLLATEIRKTADLDKFYFASHDELDITSEESVESYLIEHKNIEVIINCAAGANAEYIEDNVEWGHAITVTGPKNLAKLSKKYEMKLIHISTDYVFDGKKNTPYIEEDDTAGLSVYGRLKAEGEKEVLKHSESCAIVRTAWLFSEQCRDFIGSMIRISKNRKEVNVVYDQVGSPTYVPDLVGVLMIIAERLEKGEREIFHVTNEGVCSWYDIACTIMRVLELECSVVPILSDEFVTKAKRPNYSVLSKRKVKNRFDISIRHHQDALNECLAIIKAQ